MSRARSPAIGRGRVTPAAGVCRRCGHTSHKNPCRAKGRSGCVPFRGDDGAAGYACGARPDCPCGWRTCKCGTDVAICLELPAEVTVAPDGEVIMVPVVRGSAGASGGRVAVRKIAAGWLACRDLADGEAPAEGEWLGTEHDDEQPGHKIIYVKGEPRRHPPRSDDEPGETVRSA